MERKQNLKEPKGSAAAASKMASGRKPAGSEPSSVPTQGTSPASGSSMAHGATGENMNQGTTAQNMGRETAGQNTGEQDLLQHAKHATGEIVNQVQQRAGSQLSRQKESAATDLSHVVEAVRRFGESLGREEGGPIARYAAQYGDKAANSLERFSTYIREQDPKQLLNDVQNFGRRRPALLLGGAFLLGFAGARLIKSAMDAESQQSLNRGSQQSFRTDAPAMRPPTSPNVL